MVDVTAAGMVFPRAQSDPSIMGWAILSRRARSSSEPRPAGTEPFDIIAEFTSSSGASWEFLHDGIDEFLLEIGPRFFCYGASCYAQGLPAVALDEVSLIVDADYLDGIDYSSWGTVKALFRACDQSRRRE